MRRRQAGFSLVAAVFLLAAIGAAGAAAVRIAGVQRTTTSFALLGSRAHQAAASGVEWMAYQALHVPGSCPTGGTTTNFTLTEGGLVGFRVEASCRSDVHNEGPRTVTRYHITSLGEWQSFGSRDYVSRRLEATVSDES